MTSDGVLARSAFPAVANAGLTTLYRKIVKRIDGEGLEGVRAEYGGRILATLSQELSKEYARLVDAPKVSRNP